MNRPSSRLLLNYGLATLVAGLALLLSLAIEAALRPNFPGHIASPLFLLAVVVSAWWGGRGPGLLAAVMSYLILEFVFLPPVYTLELSWEDIPLASVYLLAAVGISTLDAKRRGAEENARRSQERMRLARKTQQRLLPAAPLDLPAFDLAGVSHPAEATGGDYFDFLLMGSGRIGIVLGDVSGHGYGAALVMSELRAYLRALALVHDDPGDILTRANTLLVNDTDDEPFFVTLFFACLDPGDRSLLFAGAGHEGIFLHATGRRERLRSTSPPLGIVKGLSVASAPAINLEPEDVVLLVSDGIYEASSRRGELFGLERAIEAAGGPRHQTAQERIDALCQAVRAFSDDAPQADDMTAVIVKVKAGKLTDEILEPFSAAGHDVWPAHPKQKAQRSERR